MQSYTTLYCHIAGFHIGNMQYLAGGGDENGVRHKNKRRHWLYFWLKENRRLTVSACVQDMSFNKIHSN